MGNGIDFFHVLLEGDLIQGIGLRETLKRICSGLKIGGFVRNREDGKVEMICKATQKQKETLASTIALEIPKNLLVNSPTIEEKEIAEDAIKRQYGTVDFTVFSVKRDSDLREMVWGLQDAGYLFLLVERKRQRNKIEGLINELAYTLDRTHKSTLGEKFLFKRLENFLLEPVVKEDLVKSLEEVYQKIQDYNNELDTKKQTNHDALKTIRDMLGGTGENEGLIKRLAEAKEEV